MPWRDDGIAGSARHNPACNWLADAGRCNCNELAELELRGDLAKQRAGHRPQPFDGDDVWGLRAGYDASESDTLLSTPLGKTCPNCFIELPKSGVCGSCG